MSNKKQFNYLNLFYGIGAFLILIAAMFKFVGWRYANFFFITGIITEAFVFLISGFITTSEDKAYDWERVFPQLDEEGDNSPGQNLAIAEGTQQQQVQKIMETVITLNSSVTELNNATKKLTASVSEMEKNYETVSNSTQKYQLEIDNLRKKISSANTQLKGFDSFNYNQGNK